MTFEITPYQKENLLEVQLPDKEFLNILGEAGVRKLVDDHYNLLRKSNISHLFARDDDEFEKAKLRSSDFLIQIMGGHPYFNENRGKPMLVQRHAPFKIGPKARLTWLKCYCEVLENLKIDEIALASFWKYINALSMRMVNSEDDDLEFTFQFNPDKS
jgi:hemoglobin